MLRTDWLEDADVTRFRTFLREVVYGPPGSLVQHYVPKKAADRHRPFDVDCFGEAVTSYAWAGRNLVETAAVLDEAGVALREAVARRDDGETLARCVDIIAWGGVSNDATAKCLVRRHDAGALALDVESAAAALLSDDDTRADAFRDNVLLRSDSAMTKVYAAQDPRSVIHDDRVGAALGRLARDFLVSREARRVPRSLAFMIGTERRRNPSTAALRFTRKRTGAMHALWNQRVNWLVADTVDDVRRGEAGFFPDGVHPHRVIEAGLFMIGYDTASVVSVAVPDESPGPSGPPEADSWRAPSGEIGPRF